MARDRRSRRGRARRGIRGAGFSQNKRGDQPDTQLDQPGGEGAGGSRPPESRARPARPRHRLRRGQQLLRQVPLKIGHRGIIQVSCPGIATIHLCETSDQNIPYATAYGTRSLREPGATNKFEGKKWVAEEVTAVTPRQTPDDYRVGYTEGEVDLVRHAIINCAIATVGGVVAYAKE